MTERQMPEEHTDQPGGRPEPEEDMPAVAAGDLKLIGRLSVPALGLGFFPESILYIVAQTA